MSWTRLRVWALACTILQPSLLPTPAAAQHEQHRTAAAAPGALVAGTVVCTDGPALASAVVQLFHTEGTERHLIASALSDASGRFSMRAPPGTYTLAVNYLGHAQHDQAVTILPTQTSLIVGTLSLDVSAVQMDAIAVTAEREQIQLRSGATVVEARDALMSAGGSVADLLRTVPGLELDAEGKIMMRGSTSVLVLLNGRRIPLNEAALRAFLKQMPASALERVEAGTSASARQDADGAAGVVNLVFRNDAQQHTTTRSITGSIGSDDHYTAPASATGSLGERLGWDAMYSFSGMRPRTEMETARESLLPNDPVRRSEQISRAQAKHRLHSVMGGATTSLGSGVSLGARGAYSWMSGAFRNHTDFVNTSPAGAAMPSATRSLLEHTIPSGEASVLLEWLGSSVRFTSDVRSAFVQEDFTGDYRDGAGLQFLSTTMDTRQNDRAWQNDVAFDLAGTRMEAGHKSRLRNIDSKYAPIGTGHDVVHVFNYEDEVHAAYLSAYRTFGSFVVQAGLRGEAERNSVNSSVGDFKARLFPSVVVQGPMEVVDDMGMRMPSMTRYRLSYGRRINRPEASALNPYTMGEDDMNSFVGNPQLRPEVSDQLEFGVEHHGMLFTWQLTPFLRITQDPIRPLKAVTESGRATTTWHNLTRTRAAGADASVRTRIGMHTTATLSGSLYGMSTEGLSYRNDGVYATVRANVDVRVTERTTVQLYAYRRGAQPIEQGEIEPMTTTELAITQTLGMRERGRVTLRLSDPFESDRVAFRISDPTFVQNSSRYVSRPLASLFLSWSVGGSAGAEAPTRERPPQIF